MLLMMNGEVRNFDLQSRATNLDTLIGQLGMKTDRVAVELNTLCPAENGTRS